ncbi:MAG: DAK2 domain-containing protein [Lachnospiraceae bacterium]|nr:DAK2 domain-containing protein [Lachnospiraceae bacterium]
MFCTGAAYLESKKDLINELNVFPVPDGDTGTNMTLTIKSAVAEIEALGDGADMKSICKAMSSGSLRGARGNSGVILSQLIRGFGKVARDKETLDAAILADAMDRAVETAYKAVMKPKEGTILTVAKGAAVKSREMVDAGVTDLKEYMEAVLTEAQAVLEKTPDMLPVLKQAGVVDSGGKGLVEVLRGCVDSYLGREIDLSVLAAAAEEEAAPEEEELRFLYKTRVQMTPELSFGAKAEKDLNKFLQSMGDSIKIVREDNVLKVRVHTNDPGMIIQRLLLLGELLEVRITNLREGVKASGEKSAEPAAEAPAAAPEPAERKENGFIAVAVGDGLAEIFRSLSVDYVIEGGQTMNPSTADMLAAIDAVNADTVYILPNNKNIIMAARQAAEMSEDKKVVVVPTTTIPQGISAMINFMPEMDADSNLEAMKEGSEAVSTVEVTYAVRDTEIDDKTIKEGDIMGIGDSGIIAVGTKIEDTSFEAISSVVTEDTEIISIYYGKDTPEEDAQKLRDKVAEAFPGTDVDLQFGGQPVYYYIMSAE